MWRIKKRKISIFILKKVWVQILLGLKCVCLKCTICTMLNVKWVLRPMQARGQGAYTALASLWKSSTALNEGHHDLLHTDEGTQPAQGWVNSEWPSRLCRQPPGSKTSVLCLHFPAPPILIGRRKLTSFFQLPLSQYLHTSEVRFSSSCSH